MKTNIKLRKKLDKSYYALVAGFVLTVKLSTIHATHDNIYWFAPLAIFAIASVVYGIHGILYVRNSLYDVDQEASL